MRDAGDRLIAVLCLLLWLIVEWLSLLMAASNCYRKFSAGLRMSCFGEYLYQRAR